MRTPTFTLSIGVLTILSACGNQDDGALTDDPHGRISGLVTDVGQLGLKGVSVTAQGQSVLTDANGHFTLERVQPAQDILIKFKKDGFSENARYANIVSWETVGANATLKAHDWTEHFSARTGGEFQHQGMRVKVPADAVLKDGKPYTGTVRVSVTYFDPYSDERAAAPGDLTALTKRGAGTGKSVLEQAQLISYGMVEVMFQDDDQVQLDLGKPVEVEIPISQDGLPEYYNVEDGEQVMLWDWSDDDGAWIEESTGEVESDEAGNETYTFETMTPGGKNPDAPIEYTCISGTVVDTIDFPVRGAQVECRGQLSSSTVTADENGVFECTVAVGDTVYVVPNTYVADQVWWGFAEVVATEAECDEVGDVKIEVCRESGVMMADNVTAYSDTNSYEADNVRAWFWEAKGDVKYCQDPFQEIAEDDCQLLDMETAAASWMPDMDPDSGIMRDTKSVGQTLSIETGRDTYILESQRTDEGVPVYHHERHEGQSGTYDDEDQLSIDESNDIDLQGGDTLVTSADGNPADYMGSWKDEEWIELPSELELSPTQAAAVIQRGQALKMSYGGADDNADGLLAFVMTDDEDTALVCRFADDGSIQIPGKYTAELSATDLASVSLYKADVGWEAGPDGLPIRMQGLTGVALPLDVR